jgi:two-component system, OmpR family, sensor kinase
MSRFGLRTRLMVLVGLAAAFTLAGLTVGFNVLLRSNLNGDANRVLEARASAALDGISERNGTLQVRESPDSGGPDTPVWVYSGSNAIDRPVAPRSVQQLADSLAGGPKTRAEDPNADLRLLAVPVVQGGKRVGTIATAISLDPYEHSASRALTESLIYAGAAFVLVLLATRLIVNRALRPVAQMTSEAAAWSEHDLEHRFNVGEPYDELTNLAATFDTMLARLASALRHEQLLSAELSHELRTPLAAIVTEAELALRQERGDAEYREALQEIAGRASQMRETLETLMAAARAESMGDRGTASAAEVVERALAACESLAGEAGVRLTSEVSDPRLKVDVDAVTAERIIAPLIENACRYAGSRAAVRVQRDDEAAVFIVTDDGPGLGADETERIFEPGYRGEAGVGDDGGAGLGLALSRRLARAVGGDVEAISNGSGASFRVRIPLSAT